MQSEVFWVNGILASNVRSGLTMYMYSSPVLQDTLYKL